MENAIKENINTDFLKLDREDGVYYKFSSKYEYKFQFIEDDNQRENSYIKGEFKISKNIIKLLKIIISNFQIIV